MYNSLTGEKAPKNRSKFWLDPRLGLMCSTRRVGQGSCLDPLLVDYIVHQCLVMRSFNVGIAFIDLKINNSK